MELFIRIVDGQPFEHPILGENFRQAFPDIDTENLPKEFAKFVRVQKPTLGVYEIYEGVSYGLVNGVWTDVHSIRQFTSEEKLAKQNQVKQDWVKSISSTTYPSWVFNEEFCRFTPPIPYPDHITLTSINDVRYKWNEETITWDQI